MSDELLACIDGRDYPYTVDINDGSYCFDVDSHRYRFRQWTWGERTALLTRPRPLIRPAGGCASTSLDSTS